jgi:hypothetical protein
MLGESVVEAPRVVGDQREAALVAGSGEPRTSAHLALAVKEALGTGSRGIGRFYDLPRKRTSAPSAAPSAAPRLAVGWSSSQL